MTQIDTSIFKSYDIRGVYPTSLDETLAEKIGRGFAKYLEFPKEVIVGRDGRVHGAQLKESLIKGLIGVGVNVIDIGFASTDMFYYACQKYGIPGISVTASHNPKEYNGFKMVKKIPELLSGDAGIGQIRDYILNDDLPTDVSVSGKVQEVNLMDEFVDYVLGLVDTSKFKNFKVFADTANGMVGPILEEFAKKLPTINFVPMYWEVDGNFPNHGGDPLQIENRAEIEKRVVVENGDIGVMFDPDGDRFFVIDKKGRFIPGDFMTAIFAEYFINRYPGCGIVYDIRASKIVPDTVSRCGGKAFANRVGHTHIKARMKNEGAYFGGEVTGHYYFKDFYLCDTGVVTLIYLLDFLSQSVQPLESIVDDMLSKYFISGEINSKVADSAAIVAQLESIYGPNVVEPIERMDGLTFEMGDWRFNVRTSNTEPLLRLNLEAKSPALMAQKRDEVLAIIRA